MVLEVEKLNSLLSDLEQIRNNKPIFVEDREYRNTWFEVYDMGLGNGAFVKLHIAINSYSDINMITGVEFVEGKEKTITVYEF